MIHNTCIQGYTFKLWWWHSCEQFGLLSIRGCEGQKSYSIRFIEKDTSKWLQLFYSWKLWIKVSAERKSTVIIPTMGEKKQLCFSVSCENTQNEQFIYRRDSFSCPWTGIFNGHTICKYFCSNFTQLCLDWTYVFSVPDVMSSVTRRMHFCPFMVDFQES